MKRFAILDVELHASNNLGELVENLLLQEATLYHGTALFGRCTSFSTKRKREKEQHDFIGRLDLVSAWIG
jgi:hypothetical protein